MLIDLFLIMFKSFRLLIYRSVSKEAGHPTNCCTKKQVCITEHQQSCTLLALVSYAVHKEITSCFYPFFWQTALSFRKPQMNTHSVFTKALNTSLRISLDCTSTQWDQMLQRHFAVSFFFFSEEDKNQNESKNCVEKDINTDPWPGYRYTGKLRPHYPLVCPVS